MNERSGRGKTKHPDEGVFAFGAETISFRVDYGIYCRIETAEEGRSLSSHIRQEPLCEVKRAATCTDSHPKSSVGTVALHTACREPPVEELLFSSGTSRWRLESGDSGMF